MSKIWMRLFGALVSLLLAAGLTMSLASDATASSNTMASASAKSAQHFGDCTADDVSSDANAPQTVDDNYTQYAGYGQVVQNQADNDVDPTSDWMMDVNNVCGVDLSADAMQYVVDANYYDGAVSVLLQRDMSGTLDIVYYVRGSTGLVGEGHAYVEVVPVKKVQVKRLSRTKCQAYNPNPAIDDPKDDYLFASWRFGNGVETNPKYVGPLKAIKFYCSATKVTYVRAFAGDTGVPAGKKKIAPVRRSHRV
jgi:hypothetical protein